MVSIPICCTMDDQNKSCEPVHYSPAFLQKRDGCDCALWMEQQSRCCLEYSGTLGQATTSAFSPETEHEEYQNNPRGSFCLRRSLPGQSETAQSSTLSGCQSANDLRSNTTDDPAVECSISEPAAPEVTSYPPPISDPSLYDSILRLSVTTPMFLAPLDAGFATPQRQTTCRGQIPSQTLIDVVPIPIPKDPLAVALERWFKTRKRLCRLRTLCRAHVGFARKYDTLIKPFIDMATEANWHVIAFHGSCFCPTEARPLGNHDIELRELSVDERHELLAILVNMRRVLGDVIKSCSNPMFHGWALLLYFEKGRCQSRRQELKSRTTELKAFLHRKDIWFDGLYGRPFASGDTNEPVITDVKDVSIIQRSHPRDLACRQLSRILGREPSLPASSGYPKVAMFQYQKLKYRFRTVPISASGPITSVRLPDKDGSGCKLWVVNPMTSKTAVGKTELDEDDRARVKRAIVAYQELLGRLSTVSSTGAVLLQHKVATRVKRYENQLKEEHETVPRINVQVEIQTQKVDAPASETCNSNGTLVAPGYSSERASTNILTKSAPITDPKCSDVIRGN